VIKMRRLIVPTIAAAVGVPFAIMAAVASAPLLRKAEAAFGIELIGHSGPADWVLAVFWLVISTGIAFTIWPRHPRSQQGEDAE
jgi:uncharacterized protein YybS (DUF2232 family)